MRMNEPFIKVDLHGMTQDQAIKVIDNEVDEALFDISGYEITE